MISPEGKQLGIFTLDKALQMAEEANLDLVEIVPNVSPVVCRIMDFGKYKYQLTKKEKLSKKKQHWIHIKEIRIRPTIDEHDIQIKMKQARKFIEQGDHVRIRILFRGRQVIHPELGQEILGRVQKELGDIAKIEKNVTTENKSLVATFVKK